MSACAKIAMAPACWSKLSELLLTKLQVVTRQVMDPRSWVKSFSYIVPFSKMKCTALRTTYQARTIG